MKFYLLIISIPFLFFNISCHRGTVEENLTSPGEESILTNEEGEITISREQFESMNMELGEPTPMMFSSSIRANGYVVASPTGRAKIGAMISGRVEQINFTTGEFVRRGQTLFSLESNEIILLQQSYAEAYQRLKLLKSDYERMHLLWEENIAAQKDFLKAESEYRTVQAEAEGLKARLTMIHIDPSEVERGNIVPTLAVKSPISGTITYQQLVLGQHVEPLETTMEVVNEDKLRLRLDVFETSLADLTVGQQVKFATPDLPERKFSASLSHIGKSVSLDSKTVECFAIIEKSDRKLFVNNMYVEASIVTCEREAIAIPEQALIREHERDYVLVLAEEKDNQMTFRQIPVQTGATRQGHTEILDENLSAVLLEGVYSLRIDE